MPRVLIKHYGNGGTPEKRKAGNYRRQPAIAQVTRKEPLSMDIPFLYLLTRCRNRVFFAFDRRSHE